MPNGDIYHKKEKSSIREMKSNGQRACRLLYSPWLMKGVLDKRTFSQKPEEREGVSQARIPGSSMPGCKEASMAEAQSVSERVVEVEIRAADGARPSLEVLMRALVFVLSGIESHKRVLPGSLWLLQHGE